MSTTSVVEGRPVNRYLGIVTGEAIIGANVFRDMFAAVRDIVGGRSATYEKALAEARDLALAEMQQRAEAIGANGIIGIDLDYEVLGEPQWNADGLLQREYGRLLNLAVARSSLRTSDIAVQLSDVRSVVTCDKYSTTR